MMARFCAYAEKGFSLGTRMGMLRDARLRPLIPTTSVFASAFVMFATGRGALHGLESDLHIPSRLRGLVGPRRPAATPSAASMRAWKARVCGEWHCRAAGRCVTCAVAWISGCVLSSGR